LQQIRVYNPDLLANQTRAHLSRQGSAPAVNAAMEKMTHTLPHSSKRLSIIRFASYKKK
jgi:hypothetical protein